MRAINHALTGAAIGLLIEEPVIAVPVAFISHYLCDMIPHYGGGIPEDEELKSTIFKVLLVLDIVLCALLVLLLALRRPYHWIIAAVCAFAAASPDLFSLNRYLESLRNQPIKQNWYTTF